MSDQYDRLDAELFAALGHPTRCAIVEFLAQRTARPTEIAKCIENTFGLWHHLGKLVDVGLVTARRLDHKHTIYAADPTALMQLAKQLAMLVEQAQKAIEAPLEEVATEELETVFAIES